MKKSVLILAAVAVMASCQDNQIKNDVNEFNESPIAFDTYAGIQTKADNNANATSKWLLENHHESFNVWAWKFYDGAWVTTAVYNKGLVSYNTTGSATDTYFKWDATPIKFWDKSAEKYYFYAAAPANEAWTLTGTGNGGKLSYANFTLAGGLDNNLSKGTNGTVTTEVPSFKGRADVDLMIAEDNEILRDKYNKNQPDKVNELFDHILSRLNVTVALKAGGTIATLNSDDNQNNNVVVKVTGFEIKGVSLKNKGTFNEAADLGTDALNEGTIKRWGPLALTGTYDLPGADISTLELDATTPLYIAQYLIIPQAITSEELDRANGKKDTNNDKVRDQDAAYPYLKLDYTIGTEPYTAYYNLAHAFGITADNTLNFCEGWQNTLNIKIDADAIVFDADVYEWKDKVNPNVTIFD
jgi:hypothetical protein